MIYKWLHRKNSQYCILFMSGWGCDYHPFLSIPSNEYDVLMCYDYKNTHIPSELEKLFGDYSRVYLVAWSLGVWSSNHLLYHWKDQFFKTLAINGTLYPINDNMGIPPTIFQGTIDNFDLRGRDKFFMRMCGSRLLFKQFQSNAPQRELTDQKEELISLQQSIVSHPSHHNLFQRAVIGQEDRIFPPANMKQAWDTEAQVITLEVPHFCFYHYNSWDSIVQYPHTKSISDTPV